MATMDGGNPKRRRRMAAADNNNDNIIPHNIIDLPIGFLVETAAYLPKPSRALFAIAMTTTSNNNRAPSSSSSSLLVSNAIIASTQWDTLNFGELESDFAKHLTDDHIAAILKRVAAPTQLCRLKLHGLINITGSSLEILRGSTVLKQIDLRGGNYPSMDWRDIGKEKISHLVVIPILESVISAEGNAFKHILGIPKPWEDESSSSFQDFVEHYNDYLGVRATACNTCGGVCGGEVRSGPWFGTERYGRKIIQRYTCQRCLNCICDERDCSLKSCRGCKLRLCKDCECCEVCEKCSDCTQSTMQTCVGDGCDKMICDRCNNTTCQNDQCNKTGCMECLGAKRCGRVDGCGKAWCSSCVTTFHCDECRRCNECAGSSFKPCPVGKCERLGNICQECIKSCRKCKATGCAKCLDYRVCRGVWCGDCPANAAHCGSCYNGPNCHGTLQVQSPNCEKCGHEFCQKCWMHVQEPDSDIDSCDYEADGCYVCEKEFCQECWRYLKPDCDVDRCAECRKEMCQECWGGSWCLGNCNTCDIKMAKTTNQWNGCECTPDCRCWNSDDCSNKGKSEEESETS